MEIGNLPMKAFGIEIFSHIRSRISRPESGADMACIISMTSEFTVNLHDKGSKSTSHTDHQSTYTSFLAAFIILVNLVSSESCHFLY